MFNKQCSPMDSFAQEPYYLLMPLEFYPIGATEALVRTKKGQKSAKELKSEVKKKTTVGLKKAADKPGDTKKTSLRPPKAGSKIIKKQKEPKEKVSLRPQTSNKKSAVKSKTSIKMEPLELRPAPRTSAGTSKPLPRKQAAHFAWWVLPLSLLAICTAILLKPKPKYPVSVTSAKLVSLFDQTPRTSTGDRIAFWSENLLHEPDLLTHLGGGPQIDDYVPLFAPGYDCTTFVEVVAALSRSKSGDDLADELIKIRYKDGLVSFDNRNHFPEADWIPNNESAGVLKDITVSVARKSGFLASFAHKDIDKFAWFKAQKKQGYTPRSVAADSTYLSTVKLPYIPISRAQETMVNIPQGAVINIVRQNIESKPVLITHQGFLIWKNGVAYFRHASRNKEITETPFAEYLRNSTNMPWKVLGFNINTFN